MDFQHYRAGHSAGHLAQPRNSTPDEIREYLAGILVQNHCVEPDEAYTIADTWAYGRGSEFYNYNLQTFKAMFGEELGMMFWLYSQGRVPGGKVGRWWFVRVGSWVTRRVVPAFWNGTFLATVIFVAGVCLKIGGLQFDFRYTLVSTLGAWLLALIISTLINERAQRYEDILR